MAGNNRLIHTPEGVKDSYNGECRKKLAVQDKILDTFYLYGYEHIQTPSFEYFDIFLGRMMMCRGAAEILGARFKLTANGSKVL